MSELTNVIYQRVWGTHHMESVSVISVVTTKRYRGYDDARVLVRSSVATESLRIWSLFYLWENDYTPFIVVGHEYDRSSDTIVVEAVSVEYNLSRWPAVHTLGTTVFMDTNDYMYEWGDPYGEVSNISLLWGVMKPVWDRSVVGRYGRAANIPKFTNLYFGWNFNNSSDKALHSSEAQLVPYYRVDRTKTIYDVLLDVLEKSRMAYFVRYIPPHNNNRTTGKEDGMYLDLVRPIYRTETIADPLRVSPKSFTNSGYTIDVRDSNNLVITASEDLVSLSNAVDVSDSYGDNPHGCFLEYKETSVNDLSALEWWQTGMENMVYNPAKSIFQAYTFTVESASPTFQLHRNYYLGDVLYCQVPNARDIDQSPGEFRWMQVIEQTSSWGPEGYKTYPTVTFPESGPGYDNFLETILYASWEAHPWN